MLLALSVRQFVIVESLELDFASGFTVMTGETGAGKSILIDALDLLLGGRADASVVRGDAAKAEISATFDLASNPDMRAWLTENELCADDDAQELLIRRVMDASGKSKSWINGKTATLSQLKEVGESLVDIHGQHAHQALMRPNAQRALLDAHAGLSDQALELAGIWKSMQQIAQLLAKSREQSERLAEIRSQLEWKMDEIASLKLSPGEWESLSEEQKRLSHAAELLQTAQSALDSIDEQEPSIAGQIERITQRLSALTDKDPRIKDAADAAQAAAIALHETADALKRYLDKTDLDPDRLTEVESRLSAIFTTARKLKARPEDLLVMLEAHREELAKATRDSDAAALEKNLASQRARYDSIAANLSKARQAACKKMSKAVNEWLAQLAMAGMVFEAVCEPRSEPSAHGMEDIVFMIRSHANANAYPISKVASGGELARISLAISVVTTAASSIPTLIFDEVDAGIGGNVAHTVGKLLRQLGESRQVLCVTHLPQVASRGHHHLRVLKMAPKGMPPSSSVTLLDQETRVDEIARMLGDEGTEATSRQHARSLLALR